MTPSGSFQEGAQYHHVAEGKAGDGEPGARPGGYGRSTAPHRPHPLFFSMEIAYVVEEVKKRKDLRAFAHLGETPDAP